ncbi:MAG: response regulator transcription factor [Lachnospiraceae bacterium]|nr:response regulator transcription factor [Lachnospiraceae bacterium]
MYNIGICDDGENICTSIENMLLRYAKEKTVKVEVQIWYTGEGLRDYLAQGNHLDILFLDIELFKMTGIEVGSYIRNVLDNMMLQIIYISGKTSYVLQLFKTQPMDFLLKPILQEHINHAMDMAINIIAKRKERFEFRSGKDYYYIAMGDIMYFESKGKKIKIATSHDTYETYGKLKDIVKGLTNDFIMIHQSYVINKEYVLRYTYEMVELVNGTILTISKINRKQVRERLLKNE